MLSSDVIEEPFPHIYAEDVFTPERFEEIKANFPARSGKNSKEAIDLTGDFWEDMFNERFRAAIMEKFKAREWESRQVRAIHDNPGFVLGPHTDDAKKVISLIFYIDGGPGTSIYVPKQEGFTHDGSAHLSFDDFIKFKEYGPKPNSMCGFRRINRSFHGVERVTAPRRTLLYNIYKAA